MAWRAPTGGPRRVARHRPVAVGPARPWPSPHPPAHPTPPPTPGPTRNRVPWRSGGSEPSMGRARRPQLVTPITRPAVTPTRSVPIAMRPINLPAYGKVEGMPTLSEDLAFRGLIHQMTDPELPEAPRPARPDRLRRLRPVAPTASTWATCSSSARCAASRWPATGPSRWPAAAPGMIGDPGGKQDERQLLTRETIDGYLEGIRPQLGQFLDLDRRPPAQQRRLARVALDARVPPRRRQALHGQPDGGQGVGQDPLRAARPGDLLHRVQLHAAPGLRLPPPARRPRLRPADRRERPVGQHHHGRRARSARSAATRRGAHHAARAQARRHEVRQDRDGHGLARPAAHQPLRHVPVLRQHARRAGGRAPAVLHLPGPRRDPRPRPRDGERTRSAGRPRGRWPGPSSAWCTARPRWPSARRRRPRSSARRSPA